MAEIYAKETKDGWICMKCGTTYESQWDATICCPYEKREGVKSL